MNAPLKRMSDELRAKIKLYNKKHIDLKDLIYGYDISNEDLSGSVISELDMVNRNMSNCNLSHSEVKLLAHNCIANNCNFSFTTFLTGTVFRGADMRKSNFNNCNAANVDFSYSDARECDFCDATFTMFSKKFYRTKFSKRLLILMKRFLDVEGLEIQDDKL
jgi:uncharacterized protein YjbI with pentapeptide repeats